MQTQFYNCEVSVSKLFFALLATCMAFSQKVSAAELAREEVCVLEEDTKEEGG